jgi:outer membrane protein OmpA-like peptidoglycan-associated protein
MRNNAFLLIALFLLFTFSSGAQTNVDINRKAFKSDKTGFKEAWEHVEKGDDFYTNKGIFYKNALDEYLLALEYNGTNPELNYKAGVSALLSDKKDAAAELFLKAYSIKNNVTGDILLVTGKALHFAGRYEEAVGKLNDYLNSPGKKKDKNIEEAKKCLAECNAALDIIKDTINVVIENSGPGINTSADDYSEVVSSDGKVMYFASRRETLNSSDHYSDYKFDENIYISRRTDGSWEPPVSSGKNLTTKYSEAPLFINNLNDTLYVYVGSENLGDIKVSVAKNGQWSHPKLIDYRINSSGRETSFTFSPSGGEIWYVTESGKDNLGGRDIYSINKSTNGKWSKPVNAGKNINTIYDEESVRFSRTGDTLYFSSKGHNTMGGFDIFYSVRDSSGRWGEAKNYGYPVNTPWDEIFYYPSPVNPGEFLFVSDRSGGLGYFDIYSGSLLNNTKDSIIQVLKPAIDSLSATRLVLTDSMVISTVEVPDTVRNEPPADPEISGAGQVGNNALPPSVAPVTAVTIATAATVTKEAAATPDPGDIVFGNIYFDTGKADLNEEAQKVLSVNLEILRKYPGIKVEIAGHTEKSDDESLNFKISEERAKAVKDYFFRNGIDEGKMDVSRYGSLMPVADNNTKEGKAKNNRVEIKIKEF